jgi:serine/threonine protein kinase
MMATMGEEATSKHLEPGAILAERYRIEAVLGEGGMGVVYQAEHVHMRKRLALKVLHPQYSNLPEVVARFEREAIAAGKVEHPNVARATDFGRLADGSFFLVLEYVAGQTLRDEIKKGPIGVDRALGIARGICLAISAAHQHGIVHRDLKPENVMLVEHDGVGDFVKVLDFGIAKVDGSGPSDENKGGASNQLTKMGSVIGTPDYMSPEQVFGTGIDGRSDLYSLGVILYEMLAGSTPFRGGAVTVLRQHVVAPIPALPPIVGERLDPRVEPIVRRLLEKEQDARYQSARDVVAAIDDLATPAIVVTPPRARTNSVSGVTTPAPAQAISGPVETLRRYATMPVLAGAGAFGALLVIACIVVAARPHEKVIVASSFELPSAPFLDALADAEAPVLPPPPAAAPPSASTAQTKAAAPARAPQPQQPKQQPQQARRTGPGGIYIPPPSQWFK